MIPTPPPLGPQDPLQIAKVAAWITLAVTGGVARYLDSSLKANKPFSWPHVLVNGFVSGFSGYMCASIAVLVDPNWALIAAGVGGYLGTQALDFLREVLFKRISKAAD